MGTRLTCRNSPPLRSRALCHRLTPFITFCTCNKVPCGVICKVCKVHPTAGCVNIWHIFVTGGTKRSDGPERRPLEGAERSTPAGHAAAHYALRPERAALPLALSVIKPMGDACGSACARQLRLDGAPVHGGSRRPRARRAPYRPTLGPSALPLGRAAARLAAPAARRPAGAVAEGIGERAF